VTTADRPVRSLPPAKLPPEAWAVGSARRRLLNFLNGEVPEEVATTAALLVSELVTNVVRHARTPLSLCADVTSLGVRVEVADGTREPPTLKAPVPGEPGGRGIAIVSHFADNWGTQPIPDGKLVWFELSLVGSQAE
jgi:anti-sigma regulatory factor (Ser/Thr protein kinase)